MAVLYTNGRQVFLTIAEFEAYSAIRYSREPTNNGVWLNCTDSGSLDLSAQLGTTSANITMLGGHNELIGGAGGDYLTTGDGNDSVYGGDGGDRFFLGAGDDWIYGGTGGDSITMAASSYTRATIFGGDGEDQLILLDGTGTLDGLTQLASQSIERVSGYFIGTAEANVFDFGTASIGWNSGLYCDGGAGDDLIIGPGGTDGEGQLFGGDGADTIYGGAGGSFIYGGQGRDVLYGSAGDDWIFLSVDGTDLVYGGGGQDIAFLELARTHHFVLRDILAWATRVEFAGFIDRPEFFGTKRGDLIDLTGFNGGANYFQIALDGGDGNDTLVATDLSDTIDGGTGADSMVGAMGDDLYFIDDAADIVVELVDEGNDRIVCSLKSYRVQANMDSVERLDMVSTGEVVAWGNSFDNAIHASDDASHAILFGLAGNDTLSILSSGALYGGAGNDDLRINNGQGDLYGGSGNDALQGGAANDRLYGGEGNDRFIGGDGDDLYVMNRGDVLGDDIGGHDTVQGDFLVWTLGLNIEDFVSTANAGVHITGSPQAANSITGTRFSDTLEGQFRDTLIGGHGDDTYVYFQRGTGIDLTLLELADGGYDRLNLTTGGTTFFMPEHLEQLKVTARSDNFSASGFEVYGNISDNVIATGRWADTINGGLGQDTMVGGAGNDIYIVQSQGDVIIEHDSQGVDQVRVYVSSWTLAAGTEYLIGYSQADSRLTGNNADNLIIGDIGNDTIFGGLGNDILSGWTGDDSLTGGLGEDSFAFGSRPLAGKGDRVTDFSHSQDVFLLVASDGGAFSALAVGELALDAFGVIGSGPVDATDRILYNPATGRLSYDPDGNGEAVAMTMAMLENRAFLSAADFFVV